MSAVPETLLAADLPAPFGDAVRALEAGDLAALQRLLAAHPALATGRVRGGRGYFRDPFLLWFVAENPIRTRRLPANIADCARAIVGAARASGADPRAADADGRDQLDYALGLVTSGCVPRECGVQLALIDALIDEGADPRDALVSALAHRELAAARRLLDRGASLTLLAAACFDRADELARLIPPASLDEKNLALVGAAINAAPRAVIALLAAGADPNARGPQGFHAHATPLHQAVSSGSLECVRALVAAGASLDARDSVFDGTPLGWADHLKQDEIATYLRSLARD